MMVMVYSCRGFSSLVGGITQLYAREMGNITQLICSFGTVKALFYGEYTQIRRAAVVKDWVAVMENGAKNSTG